MSKQLLRVEYNIPWLPQPNESQTVLSSHLPPLPLITTALALAFSGDQILMTHLQQRGWDIPGGHREAGEHPEETVRREVYEETGARLGSLRLLAYQHMRLLGAVPPNYNYPHPEAYQTFYLATVASFEDFLPTAETHGRSLFSPPAARTLSWVQKNSDLYEVALEIARSW